MVGFPKIEKMAIYNIQLFGKGGEIFVYKLNDKQHTYATSIPKEQLAEEISTHLYDYNTDSQAFHIYDAVDMEDCIIKITNVDLDEQLLECNILDFVNEDSTEIHKEFDLEDLDPDNYLCWARYSHGKFFDYDFQLDEVFNSTKMLFKMTRFENTFYIRDIWYGDEHLSALPNSPTQSVFSDISGPKDYQDLTEMRKDVMILDNGRFKS
mgnify:CR=1 FL=1